MQLLCSKCSEWSFTSRVHNYSRRGPLASGIAPAPAPAPIPAAINVPAGLQSSSLDIPAASSNGYGTQQNVLPPHTHAPGIEGNGNNFRSLSSAEKLPPDVVEDGIMTYFKCFHGQPYSLLCQKSLIGAHQPLSPVVLDPMLALAIRCSSHPYWADREKSKRWMQSLTKKSWHDLLHMYGEGHTGLHYLQGLCLLAQVDFAGKSQIGIVA